MLKDFTSREDKRGHDVASSFALCRRSRRARILTASGDPCLTGELNDGQKQVTKISALTTEGGCGTGKANARRILQRTRNLT
ncbi:hypothetical protein MPTK1_Vg00110 [Marchantia polymorpha subsp. ruderalis]